MSGSQGGLHASPPRAGGQDSAGGRGAGGGNPGVGDGSATIGSATIGSATIASATIASAFARARAEDRAALIGYLPAGFPSVPGAVAALEAMVAAGVDLVEVGLPYSDPLMDGPVIETAVTRALQRGVHPSDVLHTVAAVSRSHPRTPAVVMSYWNPIEHYGPDRFAADLAAAGGAGAITPDLTPEEAGPWLTACTASGIDPVFLVAPTSTDQRLKLIASVSRGFVYCVSLLGVTGARAAVSERAEELVGRCRAVTDLPLAVGLGVSSGQQASEVARYADGVIVGSAFVRRLLDAPDEASGVTAVAELAAELAAGVRRRPGL
jgi:tryptophan synthase alpha chain